MRKMVTKMTNMLALGLILGTVFSVTTLTSPAAASCSSEEHVTEAPVEKPKEDKGDLS